MTGYFKNALESLAVLLTFCILLLAVGVSQASSQALPGNTSSTETGSSAAVSGQKIYTGERITLEFQNADIHNVIRIIGEVSGKNIVISSGISGKVTLKLKDVPWDQALDVVLSSKRLGLEESGNVLTVYDLARNPQPKPGLAEKVVEDPNPVPPKLTKKVFPTKYAPIGTVSAELEKLKSNRGKITVIGNNIYVEDEPGAVAAMAQEFMRVDRIASQMLVEVRIARCSSAYAEKYAFKDLDGYPIDILKMAGPGLINPEVGKEEGRLSVNKETVKLNVAVLNEADVKFLNNLVNTADSEVMTIYLPRVMAANDQDISIKQRDVIGCGEIQRSSGKSLANRLKKPEMDLNLKAHIEENDQFISLDLTLMNTAPGPGAAQIGINSAATQFKIKNGGTAVIGGLIVDDARKLVDAFPVKRILPLADWLPGRSAIDDRHPELVIFVTANIIPNNF